MDAIRPWTPVPILFANAESGGPVEHAFFADTLREFEKAVTPRRCRLTPSTSVSTAPPSRQKKTIPDGVGVHARTPYRRAGSTDRRQPSTCMRMCRTGWSTQSTRLVSYRRNPHTDMAERGAEAAWIAIELLDGMRTSVAHVRMPVCAPPTQLLTAPGTGPYAEMIRRAEALDDPRHREYLDCRWIRVCGTRRRMG